MLLGTPTLIGLGPLPPAAAATAWTVNGPTADSPVSAQVSLSSGSLQFGVQDRGAQVLSPSTIGIVTSTADLSQNLTFTGRTDRTVTESYTMTTGKYSQVSDTFTETTLSFTGVGGAALNLVVRVSDEGAAYRYILPTAGSISVERETSSWTVPTGSPAWLQPYAADNQGQWFGSTAGAAPAGDYGLGALFKVGGNYALIAESDVDGRYDGSRLSHQSNSGTYTVALDDSSITTTGPLSTPWRTAVIGNLATITQSRLVNDLAPPSKIADTSWIRPGKVAWSWLTEPTSPGNENRQKQYVDFAAQNGWPYVLIDAGWDSSWIPDVVNYAKAKGVGILLWFDSSDLKTADQRNHWLPLVQSWGVAGVKIDYVFDYNHATMGWYDAVLAQTAALKLMVNFHGTEMPRGMQRTWPHVMTAEAVYGGEQKQNRAAFNTILPFTRNAVSSMDFTPTELSVSGRDTTDAHEVATFAAFESGWQHAGDNPESYQAHPAALHILNELPTAWDQTLLLSGSPGKEAYFARRFGANWYLSGISALPAKTYQTGLGFLGSGQWLAETLTDGTGGLTLNTTVVANTNTLSVPVATNGGFVTVLCPYTTGATTCGSTPPPPPTHTGPVTSGIAGKCLDDNAGNNTNGTHAQIWDCNNSSAQTWTYTNGTLRINGKCLDVTGANTANGTPMEIWDCNDGPNQQWIPQPDGTLLSPQSGRCLDDPNFSTTNGTQLVIWDCNAGSNQRWTLSS